ncbi:MAG: hypothetical protein ACOYNS_18110 [Bacteroidota bacterium]
MAKKINITVLEASDYFRGLLLLIRKDGVITEHEKLLVNRIGRSLGFEKDFCENAIHEILENEHVPIDPPVFSSIDLAKSFIKDGLLVAEADHEFHGFEEEWLRTTAERNSIDVEWFHREKELVAGRDVHIDDHLEVDNISVNY